MSSMEDKEFSCSASNKSISQSGCCCSESSDFGSSKISMTFENLQIRKAKLRFVAGGFSGTPNTLI